MDLPSRGAEAPTEPRELSDSEKAAALDDLMRAFKEEWFTVDSGGWVSIDGSGDVSPETARVLSALGATVQE